MQSNKYIQQEKKMDEINQQDEYNWQSLAKREKNKHGTQIAI